MHEHALYEALCILPVIDTHEHLENEQHHTRWNVLSDYTQHYFSCDLISAGMPASLIVDLAIEDISIRKKWEKLERYWSRCRHTGYGQMLDRAAQLLYGVDEINADTIELVEARFQALRAQPGFSTHLLKEVCKIEYIMDNIWRLDGDNVNGLYRFVTQIDDWVTFDVAGLGLPETKLLDILNLTAWVDLALKTLHDDISSRGANGLKCALAYRRSLDFNAVSLHEAECGFFCIQQGKTSGHESEIKQAQDYVMHRILSWANAEGLLLQIHTGYQEGNANLISNANPEPLAALLMAYPSIRFDLFHMGYPYQSAMGALGKMFPNARVNFCWAHTLNPIAAQNALLEWLQLMPANKLFAFGGDCRFFDGTVGHLDMARHNVAHTLGQLVDSGVLSFARAKALGRMLFYENPKDFYH